ncbi:MAG: GNAT family N-acetyltransferase [Hyphomicrobiaceae bacterium]|nr:GNAT family N-acetyltransferase [Hyphomicrobiaceae bacterium]
MFLIRKVQDATTPINKAAIAEAQRIMRTQFPGMGQDDIDRLPDLLANPLKYKFVGRLFVAEGSNGKVLGMAQLLHAPDIGFCYLEIISASVGGTGRGTGAALYERVREDAIALGAHGLYFECLPDDPVLSPDEAVRKQNARRLAFYERYGARPIINTLYETPVTPGTTNPPFLVLDPLGRPELPGLAQVRRVFRAILERAYSGVCTPEYVEMVVNSVVDDPIRLREPRYAKRRKPVAAPPPSHQAPIALVTHDGHAIHHVHDRGYVEAPIRVSAIMAELEGTQLFQRVPPLHFPDRLILEVHDAKLVDYIRRASEMAGNKKSIYPYVFPLRNPNRPPKDQTVLAGYYCIDTFTPLNQSAYLAARAAVDCALTAASKVLEGRKLAYALVRPPGHHAERHVFGGFCYFCNAAIAAQFLSRYGRIAILDIDYHHGNGQQDIFYERKDVLTVSIHGDPSFAYPYFSGFKDETGAGRGAGYNFNLPLPERLTPEQYRAALTESLKIVRRFDPAFLVVSAGFDTAKGDPTGTWSNGPADFAEIGRMIGAEGYPTLIVQEGGYRVRTLGNNVKSFFEGLVRGSASPVAHEPTRKSSRAKSPPSPTMARFSDTQIVWREFVTSDDEERVRSLVAATGFFTADEIEIAAELVRERVEKGTASGYEFIMAEVADKLAGYACFGPIAGSDLSHDLYWIAVASDVRGHGIGHLIMRKVEAAVKTRGGRIVYADTSSSAKYAATRAFYIAQGFRQQALLPDFYRRGDGKVIFEKRL